MTRRRSALAGLATALLATAACSPSQPTATADTGDPDIDLPAAVLAGRSLDGSGNNVEHPAWGAAGQPYARIAGAVYADGVGDPVDTPNPRYVSNRIYDDLGQNVFSATGLSHWAFVWGQFLDHTIGLAEAGDEDAPIPTDPSDPLERYHGDLGGIAFTRDAFADGTGVDSPREAVNTLSSYIDAWNVYGGSVERLEWLRAGPIDGDLSNNDPHLLLNPAGYLPTQADRPEDPAPDMAHMGTLELDPSAAVVAGDVRANENAGLTAVQTLFAREHNRIVDLLPADLPNQVRFELARRVVGAEEQWITYDEFLPALGVSLPVYQGYDPTVDATLTTEFATVGYRAHSFIHGELEQDLDPGDLTEDELAALEAQGVEVSVEDGEVALAEPLSIAFGNPGLLEAVGLDHVLAGLAGEAQYANDEMIDDSLRSVLFQVPAPGSQDPMACFTNATPQPGCFSGVLDLGAIDMQRALDHGIPGYNDLREAYGLPRVGSFTELTGEATATMPDGLTVDDPDSLAFTSLREADGTEVEPFDDDTVPVVKVRATTLASRLAAVYGSVDEVDAFTGMLAERHAAGAELGSLQLAMWERQFAALRDGDRFFYGNDPVLEQIRATYGIDFRMSLSDVIAANTDAEVPADVFHVTPTADGEDAQSGGGGDGEAAAGGGRSRGPREPGPPPRVRGVRGHRRR